MGYFDEPERKYDDVFTIEDLMDYLSIGRNTAYKLLKEGKIKFFKIGRVYKIPKEEVKRFVKERQH